MARADRAVDFVLAIDGRENSRLVVQERYEVLRAMFYHETHDADAYLDPPDADTPLFKPIELMSCGRRRWAASENCAFRDPTAETGAILPTATRTRRRPISTHWQTLSLRATMWS